MTPAEAPICRIIATSNEVCKTTFALPVLQRRFPRSIRLLLNTCAPAVDQAICNMNDGETPKPVFFQAGLERTIVDAMLYAQLLELAR
jgi:hypothetical protein